LYATILEQSGAEVTAVGGVQDALRALEVAGPDVIVSDLAMPGQDGYALIAHLRDAERRHGRPAIPVIALTAYGGAEERHRTLAAGFQVHIDKPVTPAELVAAVAGLSGPIPDTGKGRA
jgi:CheY-like chemotaxis protein